MRIAVFVLIAVWSSIALGQAVPHATPNPTPVSGPEVAVLTAQLQTMQAYQDQFISIVSWSLAAVLAMALGLAAFNWYSSRTSYDRDIQALRQENKALHAELSAIISRETEQASARISEQLAKRQSEIQAALSKMFDPKISDLKNGILNLEFNFTRLEAENAATSKSFAWAVYKYCRLLEISVRQGSDHYEVGEILDRIGDLVDKPETSLTADNVTDAVEVLKNLPRRYQTAADNVIPRIRKAHK